MGEYLMPRTAQSCSRLLPACAVVLLLCLSLSASAEPNHPSVDPHNIQAPLLGGAIDISSAWLVTPGDDPRYADPAFDDSKWMVIHPGGALGKKGITDALWYRTHLTVPPASHNLAFFMQTFAGSQEVFVNGVRIGGQGALTPGGERLQETAVVYPIPDTVIGDGHLVIAVRARIGLTSNYGQNNGGIWADYSSGVYIGNQSDLLDHRALFFFRDYTSNATLLILEMLVLLIALSLAIALRREPEYLSLAIATASRLVTDSMNIAASAGFLARGTTYILAQTLLGLISTLALLEFVRIVLGYPRTRLIKIYYLIYAATAFLENIIFATPLLHILPTSAQTTLIFIFPIVNLPVAFGLPLICLWVWFRRRNPDALLLAAPLFVSDAYYYYTLIRYLLSLLHLAPDYTEIGSPLPAIYTNWTEISQFAFGFFIVIFLVLRTVRVARERANSAAEVHAVQTLQQLLLARASQATPGYVVETAYRPASEVGGDFYLVSPAPDGSIIVIVGDVSGKGLLAAMRVSLILGALNREESRQPETILQNLNQALLSQGDVGFTTACCLRLEPNGDFTFANAGHLNPYLDGRELPSPGALPLGLQPGQTYTSIAGHLAPAQRIVLLSDGVPEARTRRGELYGFEKLLELTRLPASTIANTAQTFGQTDDITVLALALA
jgi:hypothetical protein